MDQHSARHVVDRAVKSALTERRPAVVIVPDDVAESDYGDPPYEHGSVFTSATWSQPHMVPDALGWAEQYARFGVRWYEEPVSSDDLAGLRLIRDRAPGGMNVTAGEYGWNLPYFQRMLDAGAVDCLQADVTRCGGISWFLRVAALCDARSMDLSAHCAPQLSAHACTAVWHLRHLENFHYHNRIEHLAFDGCLEPEPGGVLRPDRTRPGLGLAVRWPELEQWRVR